MSDRRGYSLMFALDEELTAGDPVIARALPLAPPDDSALKILCAEHVPRCRRARVLTGGTTDELQPPTLPDDAEDRCAFSREFTKTSR